jgi:hypothetical protein
MGFDHQDPRSLKEIVMANPQTETHGDIAPLMKFYMDSFETWKKNYETLTRSMTNGGAEQHGGALGNAMTQFEGPLQAWQKMAGEYFHRFVETQMELCRFYESRWSQYLKIQETLSSCRSPTEIGDQQASFFNRFLNDYTAESKKLMQSFADLTAKSMTQH